VKSDRLHRLQALLAETSLAFNAGTVGRSCDILIERRGRQAGQWIGKSPWLQSVVVTDPSLKVGDIVRVEIVKAGPNSVEGRLLQMKTAA
jgi:tRNA-2-methylthio-N6-dimethylallyladenosine synthase